MPRFRFQTIGPVVLAALLVTKAWPQSPAAIRPGPASDKAETAIVNSVRLVYERGLPAIEVVSTRPLIPAIQPLDSPPRLVIDLANARVGLLQKRISVLQESILTIRNEQFRKDPPVMRIVVDLLVPYGYTWDAAGNRLMIRLKRPEASNVSQTSAAQPPQVLSTAPDSAPLAVPVSSGVGDIVLAGKQFAAGSSLTAGNETAILRLARGGEVRVCPGTALSLTPSKSTKDLMLGMSTGALEVHYSLQTSVDTVLTPDFRILFSGPGEFHYAISSDSHGNTCVRGLRGNESSAVVSELIGDRTYKVEPTEQAVFHTGRIDKVDSQVPLECGCPPVVPVMKTQATPAGPAPASQPSTMTLAQASDSTGNAPKPPNDSPKKDAPQTLSSGPEAQPLPPSQQDDVHITVDVPFVFHGKAQAPPPPTEEAATLPVMESSVRQVALDTQVQPPPAQNVAEQKAERRGVMRRVKGFFAALFR